VVFQAFGEEAERKRNGRRQPPPLPSIYRSFDELRQWVCIGCEVERLGE
jgi:formate hydrogenlyase subunit 6/NADH:ubiquinone oxidoreductase subunit I